MIAFRGARLASPLIGAVVMLGVACGGGGSEPSPPAATVEASPTTTSVTVEAPAEASPTAAATSTPTAAPDPTATATPDAPREAAYGDLLFAVTDVVESNETWRSYGGSGTPEVGEDAYLYVHLDVTNRLTKLPLTLRSDLFYLESGGEQTEALRLWSQSASKIVAPGATVAYITGFRVSEDFDLAAASLVMAEPGTVPASVVLRGPPAAQAYPIEAELGDEPSPINAGGACDDLTADPVRAVIDLDAGIDGSGVSGNVDGGRRAKDGERFLRIDMHLSARDHDCAVKAEFFRLQADGKTIEASNRVSTSVKAGETLDFSLVYRVPVGAQDIALLAGAVAGSEKPFPIRVSDYGP